MMGSVLGSSCLLAMKGLCHWRQVSPLPGLYSASLSLFRTNVYIVTLLPNVLSTSTFSALRCSRHY